MIHSKISDFLQNYLKSSKIILSPGPVACLKIFTVDESSSARLQERSSKHTDIVETTVWWVGIVTKLFRTAEVSLLWVSSTWEYKSSFRTFIDAAALCLNTLKPPKMPPLYPIIFKIRSPNFKCQNTTHKGWKQVPWIMNHESCGLDCNCCSPQLYLYDFYSPLLMFIILINLFQAQITPTSCEVSQLKVSLKIKVFLKTTIQNETVNVPKLAW